MPKAPLVDIVQLSEHLGVTVRRLEEDCKEGMPVARTGARGKRLFDVEVCRAWRRANRRQVYGEGRGRASPRSDAAARITRLASEPATARKNARQNSKDPTPEGDTPRAPNVDLGELDPSTILSMVMAGTLDLAHISIYEKAMAAMERGVDFRKRMASIVDAGEVSTALDRGLSIARSLLDAVPDAMVDAVGAAVALTDSQRGSVRAAAVSCVASVVDALATACDPTAWTRDARPGARA